MAFNKVTLLGNLTADPETRTTPSGQSVTSFSLAVNRTWQDRDGQRQEATDFINCTAWGPRGETIAKYVSKGRQLLVSGRLQQRTWDDKDTGKKRSAIDVVVEEFSFVNDGRGDGARANSAKQSDNDTNETIVDDVEAPIDLSDIPF